MSAKPLLHFSGLSISDGQANRAIIRYIFKCRSPQGIDTQNNPYIFTRLFMLPEEQIE